MLALSVTPRALESGEVGWLWQGQLNANGFHTLRATAAAPSEISRPITWFPASANAATS